MNEHAARQAKQPHHLSTWLEPRTIRFPATIAIVAPWIVPFSILQCFLDSPSLRMKATAGVEVVEAAAPPLVLTQTLRHPCALHSQLCVFWPPQNCFLVKGALFRPAGYECIRLFVGVLQPKKILYINFIIFFYFGHFFAILSRK
jgi:hypothetical protein